MSNIKLAALPAISLLLCQCAIDFSARGRGGPPNMGGPTLEERNTTIASEELRNFYYGRRYYVQNTRFWGYLRSPRQSADKAELVIMREDRKLNPDRLSEDGPLGKNYGFDQNYEYQITGKYTGETAYEPNSNQFLPVFLLMEYEVIDTNPGWFFSPADHYNPYSITLLP